MENELMEIIEYYGGKTRRCDQGELVELLREAQELCGGVLTEEVLETVCSELNLKRNYLDTVMKFIPDLKTEKVKHRLDVCGGQVCKARNSLSIASYIESEYGVTPGKVSEKGEFLYRVTGCMKNCKNGPCIRYDGEVFTEITPDKLKKILEQSISTDKK